MPWIGIRSALRAVRGSKDRQLVLLVGMARRLDMFEGMDITGEEAHWQQLVECVTKGIGDMIVEVTAVCGFADMAVAVLEQSLAHVTDDEWSKEQVVAVPVQSAHCPGPRSSVVNADGVELQWEYTQSDSDSDSGIRFFAYAHIDIVPHTLRAILNHVS
jgi:hypothetical protein